MILFEKVRWKNFLSTGNQYSEINFQGKSTTLITGSQAFFMFDPTKIKQGFFTNILHAFSDLDASIIKQSELRKKESQLLPLLYFTCFIMLLSQLIQVTSKVQEAPYLSIVTGVVVSYLFFLPIFIFS